ncbi:unnamed protein product [Linum tenue]|uniref:C2H2-type domain-containing protein n=1 Tax=Linum tenue TaxID=586396 RepID=A0AAV0JFN5_9ROSI|nr:unnamed protein product [Linum tenue]
MQFWGVEVKSGEPLPVQCGDDFILHLSQATLGECKKDKGNGSVSLSVKVGGKKLVLGTLYPEKVPQLQFDLVFERDFELSHTGKNGSVYFMGYQNVVFSLTLSCVSFTNEDSESEMEPLPAAAVNGGPISLTNENKPAKREKAKSGPSGTKHVQIIEPKKDDEESDDDSSDEDRWLATQGKPVEVEGESDEEDDDEDDDSDDEEETDEEELADTKKKDTGKKRSAPEAKTPAPSKKTKLVTPQKTGGKKAGEHQATPHPAKQASKTASTSDSKSHVCKSCDRTFGSDNALQSHTKAKHGDAK